MKRILAISHKFAYLVFFGFTFFFALSALTPLCDPNTISWLSLLGLFYPYFLVVYLIAGFLLFKRRIFWFIFAVVIIGFLPLSRYIGFHKTNHTGELKVLSYNVEHLAAYRDGNRHTNKKSEIFDLIAGENPDFICLQEFGNQHDVLFKFRDDLKAKIGHLDHKICGGGMQFFSKYPIIDHEQILLDDFLIAYAIHTKVNNKTITFINVHLKSNSITKDIQDVKVESKEINRIEKSKNILTIINRNDKLRARQVQTLRSFIDNNPYPTIVSGDFNSAPHSYVYHHMHESYIDMFDASGSGLGFTYNQIPLLKIDYSFCTNDITPKYSYVIRKKYSDHYPLVSTFSLNAH